MPKFSPCLWFDTQAEEALTSIQQSLKRCDSK